MLNYLDICPEVKDAIDNDRPVVALESTIISHGMSYPENVESAKRCEEEIRQAGGTPATIAIIGGRMKVGLTDEELNYFGKTGLSILKASRRDIPMILAKKLDGATTVATTMMIAELAGIKVFATGGIGGVHRNAQTTFDISADLMELAQTNVAVVCAGAKSILDIGLTLEYLETHGVPVIGYQTDDFPAFYTRTSGFSVDYNGESAKVIAEAIKVKEHLKLVGGMVIANPIPEEYALEESYINKVIDEAVADAEAKGIRGKEITPFILSAILDITEGKSLYANKQLVYNNARVATMIAKELCHMS
ncbi:pseudouridine-5'-phosphate glycosidase [Vallitalea pronyensis]|uniref:Pseudouridine-5'-phosphate glycosidase n=1 Tax=Vallitalea pronyensis TaxID=1348613 RepID=A0A8J8SIK5_9FIRM|nr:pseudouridine-5'-phosphate glycosidase [Vallitalea pronyensis]QUI25030.1 pseudouridine-5'-phosphate glycosidase [Vallitalea pronyensis]